MQAITPTIDLETFLLTSTKVNFYTFAPICEDFYQFPK